MNAREAKRHAYALAWSALMAATELPWIHAAHAERPTEDQDRIAEGLKDVMATLRIRAGEDAIEALALTEGTGT